MWIPQKNYFKAYYGPQYELFLSARPRYNGHAFKNSAAIFLLLLVTCTSRMYPRVHIICYISRNG